jgi:hypothetical protein
LPTPPRTRAETSSLFKERKVNYPTLKLVDLRLTPEGGHHRLIDGSPITNITRGIVVRLGSMPTLEITEVGLIFPIALIDRAARIALTAGVARIDQFDHDASLPSFVFDK